MRLRFLVAFLGADATLRRLVAGPVQDTFKVGTKIDKLKFIDIRYLPRTLADFGPKKAFVLVFTNTTCPVARRYLPVMQGLAKEYAAQDVQFVAVNSAEEDSIVAMATQAVQHDVEFPFVKDAGGACALALGVLSLPEVVVLDGEHRLRYRGRIDDQYRLAGTRAAPTRHDLKEALDAVLAGRDVAVAETEVDGCPITTDPRAARPPATLPLPSTWRLSCGSTAGSATRPAARRRFL